MAEQATGRHTRGGRWAAYGTNVAVAVVVAAAIVLLINGVAYRSLGGFRYDMTGLRRYSLSEQTRQVLRHLNHDYRVITVIASANPMVKDARDLIDEYRYVSPRIQVEHVDPLSRRREALLAELEARFEPGTAPWRDAVAEGRQALLGLRDRVAGVMPLLNRIRQDPELAGQPDAVELMEAVNLLRRFAAEKERDDETLGAALEQPLPDVGQLVRSIRDLMLNLTLLLEQSVQRFRQHADAPGGAAATKEAMLRAADEFVRMQSGIADAIAATHDLPDISAYERVRQELAEPDAVLILGPTPEQTHVLPVSRMFRQESWQEAAEATDQRLATTFLGEEQITGMLASMEMDRKPLVVFVFEPDPRTGQGPGVEVVTERLRTMGVEMRQWRVTGQRVGQVQRQAEPLPVPDEGQKVVWIIMPMAGTSPLGEAGLTELKARLEQGDAAMILFQPNREAAFGASHPFAAMVESWGVLPRVERRLLRRVILPNNQETPDNRMIVTAWPGGLPMTEALGELPAVFPLACPLEIRADAPPGVTITPLATVRGEGLWAEADVLNRDPKFSAAAGQDQFVIAAAVEHEATRRIVTGDGYWMRDAVTTAIDPYLLYPVAVLPPAYPGNADLFVNSVFWLAEVEQLIGRSARVQSIRPVGALGEVGALAITWGLLAGLPMVALVSGAGIWMLRRRH